MSAELKKNFNGSERGVPGSPYLKAKQEWDDRIGTNVMQARSWRMIAFSLIGVVVLLVVFLAYVGSQPKYIPYIIEISDSKVTNIAKVHEVPYAPTDASLKYYLGTFVEKTRSLSIDRDVNKKWILEAYAFVSAKVAEKLDNSYAESNSGRAKMFADKETVSVTINSFTPVTKNTYQVQWQEDVFDAFGHRKESNKMVGFLTITISAPVAEKSILMNPMGIWVTDFTWSKAKDLV